MVWFDYHLIWRYYTIMLSELQEKYGTIAHMGLSAWFGLINTEY